MKNVRYLSVCVVLAVATAVQAESVWGTASDINGFWGGSAVFKTDLDTGATTILKRYTWSDDSIMWLGDIAQANNGWLYATAYQYDGQTGFSDGFDQLLKISPKDGSIAGRWDLGGYYNQINALTAVNATKLYGVEGGGFNDANLVEITLDGSGNFAGQQRLGVVGDKSDGDIAFDPATGQYYIGSFWDGGQPVLRSIDIGPPASGTSALDLQSGYTSGLVFSGEDLWASNWTHMRLYTIDTTDGSFSDQYDLSGPLGNTGVTGITGLSSTVPEPATMIAVFGGVAGVAGYIRKRRTS